MATSESTDQTQESRPNWVLIVLAAGSGVIAPAVLLRGLYRAEYSSLFAVCGLGSMLVVALTPLITNYLAARTTAREVKQATEPRSIHEYVAISLRRWNYLLILAAVMIP